MYGKNEYREDYSHQKSNNRNCMNSLWEHSGYLTKYSFDSFSGIRDQKVLPRFIRLLGVTFLAIIKLKLTASLQSCSKY